MRLNSLIVLSFAVLLTCGSAAAAEVRHLSADGSASCPENTASNTERNDLDDVDPAAPAPVRHTEKAKTVAAPRSSSSTRATTPRWHSFLPGMFR